MGAFFYTSFRIYNHYKYKKAQELSRKDNDGSTPLINAVLDEDMDAIDELLYFPLNVNIEDRFSKTALYYATCKNHIEMVKSILCNSECNPNIIQKKLSTTEIDRESRKLTSNLPSKLSIRLRQALPAIIIACREGFYDIVKILLEDPRVNPNITDNYGRTALYHAMNEGRKDIIKLLVSNKRVKHCEPHKIKELDAMCISNNATKLITPSNLVVRIDNKAMLNSFVEQDESNHTTVVKSEL